MRSSSLFSPQLRHLCAFIERFNRAVRHEWLDEHLFESIKQAQQTATEWLWRYNHERPHMALGGIFPKQMLGHAA